MSESSGDESVTPQRNRPSSLSNDKPDPDGDIMGLLEHQLLILDGSILLINDLREDELNPDQVSYDLMGAELARFSDSLEELRRLGESYIDLGRSKRKRDKRRGLSTLP
jgi:hypothetical protein